MPSREELYNETARKDRLKLGSYNNLKAGQLYYILLIIRTDSSNIMLII